MVEGESELPNWKAITSRKKSNNRGWFLNYPHFCGNVARIPKLSRVSFEYLLSAVMVFDIKAFWAFCQSELLPCGHALVVADFKLYYHLTATYFSFCVSSTISFLNFRVCRCDHIVPPLFRHYTASSNKKGGSSKAFEFFTTNICLPPRKTMSTQCQCQAVPVVMIGENKLLTKKITAQWKRSQCHLNWFIRLFSY